MKATIETKPRHTRVALSGEIDLYNASELKSLMLGRIEGGDRNFIVHLAQVAYIDSTGIGALLGILGDLKKKNGRLKLAELSPGVNKVFQLTRLTSFFEIYETEQAAAEALDGD